MSSDATTELERPSQLHRWLARFFRRLIAVVVPLIALLLIGPLGLLTVLAETRAGRLVGWIAVAIVVALLCGAALAWPVGWRRVWLLGLSACLLSGVGLAVVLARLETPPVLERESGLQSVVLGPAGLMRPGLLGRLPEIDLVKLVAAIGSRLVPGIDRGHARRIRVVTARLYRELEADDVGRTLPTVTHAALAELLGRPFDAGHYFAYVPASRPGERLGVIVFLHGNAGNFKMLPWAWRQFAESRRFVILCPTYGFGLWGAGGVEAVDRCLDDASRRWPIESTRVYLAGISDGGNGVTRSGSSRPSRFRGLIYISPTLRVDELIRPAFVDGWQGRPVLVLHGDRDVNVHKEDVDAAVNRLRAQRVAVTYRVFPGEDHFLFFGRGGEVFCEISAWMDAAGRPSAIDPPE